MIHKSLLLLLAVMLLIDGMPSRVFAWGAMHSSITQGAFAALPAWQQELWAAQRTQLIQLYCMIPDLAQAPAYKAEFTRLVVLPNGDLFSHQPFKTRDRNAYQISYYVEKAVSSIQAHELEDGAKWAGCLLHFLEDSGSPAHTMPGDNQMGLIKDMLPVPDEFKGQPLHSLIEEGKLWISIAGYQPKLLGTTTAEAVSNLMERYHAMVRNSRAQVVPILQGVFKGAQEEINAGQSRAAIVDAQVVADALYTIICIAKQRFDVQESAALAAIELASLTPMEVIHQSYFPQYTYFSDPYFGFPIRDAILGEKKLRQPLILNVGKDAAPQEFKHGLGLGTSCHLTYLLPNKVYDQFEAAVGLHALLGKAGKMAFKIYGDGKVIFDSGLMMGDSPAQKISVPIWGVKELLIVTEGRNSEKGHNYAVIAEPTLLKTKDPQKLKEGQEAVSTEPKAPTEEMLKNPVKIRTE